MNYPGSMGRFVVCNMPINACYVYLCFLSTENENTLKVKNLDEQKKVFTNLWIDFLQLKVRYYVFHLFCVTINIFPYISYEYCFGLELYA
jgi:hypothetical protein